MNRTVSITFTWHHWPEPADGTELYADNRYFNGNVGNDDHSLVPYPGGVPYVGQELLGRRNCSSLNSYVMFYMAVHGTVVQATSSQAQTQNYQNFDALEDMIDSGAAAFTNDIFT